jgi:hypothetical protein
MLDVVFKDIEDKIKSRETVKYYCNESGKKAGDFGPR